MLDEFTADVLDLVRRAQADQTFAIVMKYAYQVSDTERDELKSFFDQLGPEAQEAYMSTTLERGVAQGRAEGRSEGRAEGRSEGVARTLTRLLVKRFGPLTPEQTARIQAAAPDRLDAWVDRFTDATSIDDVLR
ncbi:DUF4351 domain-containing protein [Ruania rhizosphaerae]|uniref:DUF4351 domain-containing protein n=1 Tax=Ruania rhizosphaerae TaxID=1840413 RepID=UPI00135CDC15|nr:DUF4351 domain-containing protein [Ruania rhizosphaerae]